MSKETALAAAVVSPAVATIPEGSPVQQPVDIPSAPIQAEQGQPDAARFAAIARKEAALVKERESFKRELETYSKEKDQVRGVLEKAKKFEELRQKDGVAALKEVGFSETDIFNLFASLEPKPEPTPQEKAILDAKETVSAEIKAFKEEQAKKEASAQDARNKQLIDGLKSGMSDFVKANAEKYELCTHYGEQAVEQAYEIIKEGLRLSNGEDLIDFKEAIDMTESFYEEEAKKIMVLKKLRPTPAQPEQTQKPQDRTRTISQGDPNYKAPQTITRTRTLTNDSRAPSTASIPRNETHDQKKERLINLIKTNGLKKS